MKNDSKLTYLSKHDLRRCAATHKLRHGWKTQFSKMCNVCACVGFLGVRSALWTFNKNGPDSFIFFNDLFFRALRWPKKSKNLIINLNRNLKLSDAFNQTMENFSYFGLFVTFRR